jgi:hypothetical protein
MPEVFRVDHGSDFTSARREQVMADLRIRPRFLIPGQPRRPAGLHVLWV